MAASAAPVSAPVNALTVQPATLQLFWELASVEAAKREARRRRSRPRAPAPSAARRRRPGRCARAACPRGPAVAEALRAVSQTFPSPLQAAAVRLTAELVAAQAAFVAARRGRGSRAGVAAAAAPRGRR